MAYSEDHIALAAEYALGTLDADERAQVATMMAVDQEFAAVVQAWQFRLGVLNQMVGTIEPRPMVWENIQREIAQTISTQESLEAPPVLLDAPPPPLPELSSSELSSSKPSSSEPSSEELPAQQAASPDVQPPSSPDSDVIPDIAPQFIPQTHAPDPRIAPVTQVPVADNSNVIYLESRVKRWRTIASAVGALAAALLVTLSLQIFSPDVLP